MHINVIILISQLSKVKGIFNEYGILKVSKLLHNSVLRYTSYRESILLYTVNLAHPDCITVVVYGSLVDAHNLRSQSWLVVRLYLAWYRSYRSIWISNLNLGMILPVADGKIEPGAQLQGT